MKVSLKRGAVKACQRNVHLGLTESIACNSGPKRRFCFQNRKSGDEKWKSGAGTEPSLGLDRVGILAKSGHQKAGISIPDHERRRTRTGFSGS